ncbi:dioxygenase [Nocardioides sp. TRM66260-LWL]|uniref:dioxygenase family protein n=1 Tax=Nocardioides sp. TRM66260-LWL TaxID=2874478 RepID=UPI001CC5C40A|nr:class III extradiol ring-cleavage dioxygenase [Nocardioides sp. TRM66260-LWL]MBZ5734602.1 dioxygenase [Nocardioides sp. TRM66260-LWL]
MTHATGPMPALYIGHGAPPLLDDPVWSGELAAWAQDLPRPTAILIVSAHWESAPITLSADHAPLVYDFGGFDPKYSRMTYRTPAAADLARRIAAMMPPGEPVHQHTSRGLDHGAWVPLRIMYPDADIPVLQMSLPTHDPGRLLQLGARLRPLRDEGVLVIGSGFLTHGLPFLREFRIDAEAPGWSRDFDAWAAEALAAGDVDALANFRELAPGLPYAHPTVEHYSPLFVTLGAASDPSAPGEQRIDGFWMGLSKRSLQVA